MAQTRARTPPNTAMNPNRRIDLLHLSGTPPLDGWYAEPLTRDQARELHAHARALSRQRPDGAISAFCARVQEWVARHWLGHSTESDYLNLRAAADGAEARALVELIWGQLLISAKRSGAFEHLDAGFAHAVPLLSASQYLNLLKRHELLAHLPLTARGAPAQGLDALLCEAAVKRRLESSSGVRRRYSKDPNDTVG